MTEITNTKKFIKEYNKAFSQEENQVILYITDTPLVAYGEDTSLDLDYVNKNKLDTIKLHAPCGTCICLENDISILAFSTMPTLYAQNLIEDLKAFLEQHKLACAINKNDLLVVSGKSKFKVASYCIGQAENKLVEAFHLSYSMDVDLINSVCIKEQIKKPKGLKDLGINHKELYDFINLFILQHNII